jgi:formyl-CoA transferase
MESLVPEYQMQGFVRERSGASMPGIAPTNTYRCGDGLYVAIAGNGDGIFRRFMQAIDRPDLAQDPELSSNDGRAAQAQHLDDVISEWTGRHELAEVLAVLESASVPAGRIYTAADIATDPHYAARGMIEHHHLPDGQAIDLPGIVPKLSATPGATQWLGPTLGEHTADVLASIGIDAAALEQLRSQGVV